MAAGIQNLFVDLNDQEAEALAQFLKRVGLSDFRALAKNDQEAYAMQAAASKIAKGLAEKGYEPR